jgi:signal transduction histidine kinase/DNA-binding response OmpR family regulator/Flp pilus assembly protein TadD
VGVVVFSSFGQSSNKVLDSLYRELDKHTAQDSNRVLLLSAICLQEQVGTNQKNKALAEESLALSQKLNYTKGIGLSLRNLAQHYRGIGDYDQAAKYAYQMATVLEPTRLYKFYGQSYALLGFIFDSAGDLKKAEEYSLKALDIFLQHHITRSAGYAQDNLGYLYRKLNKLELAEKYHQQALDLRLKENDTEALIQSYAQIALVHKARKQYDKAIASIKKSMELQEKIGLVDNEFTAGNYANLGEVYYLTGRFNEAEPLLLKAVAYAKLSHHKANIISIYETLVQMEKARGNYKQAMHYLTIHDQYKDSVFTETKEREYAKMQTLYETAKKNQTIKELENEQAAQRLKQWLLTGGILMILVASFVIYLQQRAHNKKTHALLQTQHQLNARLQETDQLKSRFFANISHEFRTPLSLIITPVEDELRKNNQLPPVTRNLFSQVNRQAHQLLSLVNDLLDLSKLDAKKMELWVKQGNLAHFMQLLTASFDSLAESKKIAFEKRINLRDEVVWFDGEKIEKILNNLLINAFKFTPSGKSVSIDVTQDSGKGTIGITVADKGIGIAAEEQEHIFTSFYQVRNSADDVNGTGLGLALVKELVDLYKGTLHLESKIGEGTTITVTLPATIETLAHAHFQEGVVKQQALTPVITTTVEQAEEETADANEQPGQPTVLIVEDHDDLRHFISSIVKEKYAVIAAKDGEEGWTLATEHMPDLIISDVMMPRMSGTELCEKIKTDERTSHIPVILLTAKADLESRLTGLKTGADDYLAKPFSTVELSVRAHNLLELRRKLAEKYKQQIGSAAPALSILPESPQEPSMDERFLNKARERVLANLDNSAYGVEEFATDMSLSRTQLFRKLKAIVGMSPNEFINEIRLLRAAEMIKAKTDTLSQIAYAVGFNEQSYFTKCFKKKFGVTPSVYAADHGKEVPA